MVKPGLQVGVAPMGQVRRPETLTEAVIRHIREAVINGDLSPGSPLPEVQLAQQLETSRGTVREALRALQDLGLVEIQPHRGAVVTEISVQSAHEMVTMRWLLEGHAARAAVEDGRMTPEAVARLEAAFDAMLAAEQATEPVRIDAHLAFHRTVAMLGGNRLLVDSLEGLQIQTRRLIVYTNILGTENPGSHRPIVDALLGRDAAFAEAVVRNHTRASGERVLARLAERQQGGTKR